MFLENSTFRRAERVVSKLNILHQGFKETQRHPESTQSHTIKEHNSPGTVQIRLRTNSRVVSLTSHCMATRRRSSSSNVWPMTSRISSLSTELQRAVCLRRMLRNAEHVWLYSCEKPQRCCVIISTGTMFHLASNYSHYKLIWYQEVLPLTYIYMY